MKIPLFILLLFSTISVFSQSSKFFSDSEYQNLQEKVRIYTSSNIDSAFVFANQIEKTSDYLQKSFALGAKSYLYQLKGDSLMSKKLYKQSLTYFDQAPNSTEKIKNHAYLLNYGGLAEWKRGNLDLALKAYFYGKKLSLQIKDVAQVVKFNNNIASIYSNIGNFKLAIVTSRESDDLINKNTGIYTLEKLNRTKSFTNYNLGSFYENLYFLNVKNSILIDSAEYFYKQTIIYSKEFDVNNTNAKMNLGSLYKYKKKFKKAEQIYLGLLKSNNNYLSMDNFAYLNLNLGELYFDNKKIEESLVCFQKVDSVRVVQKTNNVIFNLSNYYLAKIYTSKNENEKALENSKIYLENFEKSELKLNDERLAVNYDISKVVFKKEMIAIQQKTKNKVLVNKFLKYGLIIIFVLIVFFLIWNINQKKKANEKVDKLIKEFKIQNSLNKTENLDLTRKEKVTLNLDEEKEKEIVKKLKDLEVKLVFLNQDYTQQFVAKKIKTNTTYLSYIVNKHYHKSFSEYANELKVNYVINQLITNSTYRKYSTQAIAESAGFKNATSFTKSFSKRTGVSPVQFAKKIDETKTTD